MLFGSKRDFNTLTKLGRELVQDIIEQEILYYKLSLNNTDANLYGEALDKTFFNPVKLNCLVTRGDQVFSVDEFGPDMNRDFSFAFIREDLVKVDTLPEVGDILEFQKDLFEVDAVRENQLFAGRDSSYNLTDYGSRFGSSYSIIVDCHLTRVDKVGILKERI